MILLTIIAIMASFPTFTAEAEGIVAPQDTARLNKRRELKPLEENTLPLEFKADIKLDKTAPARKEPSSRNSKSSVSKQKGENGDSIKQTSAVATYPGGTMAMRDYIRKNVRYPAECRSGRLVGKAIVAVTIMPDGTPADASIHKSSGNQLMDAEALRVVGQMPKWTPASTTEEAKEFITYIPVNFRPRR